jgi:hypothetical protein
MNLQKELLTPRYEVHQFSFEQVVLDDFQGEGAARVGRRERAAEVLLAAAGTVSGGDVRAVFGRETFETKRSQYQELYTRRVAERAQDARRPLTKYYEDHPPSKEGFGRDLQSFASTDDGQRCPLTDPWGNQLTAEGAFGGDDYASFRPPVVRAGRPHGNGRRHQHPHTGAAPATARKGSHDSLSRGARGGGGLGRRRPRSYRGRGQRRTRKARGRRQGAGAARHGRQGRVGLYGRAGAVRGERTSARSLPRHVRERHASHHHLQDARARRGRTRAGRGHAHIARPDGRRLDALRRLLRRRRHRDGDGHGWMLPAGEGISGRGTSRSFP